MSTKCLLLLTGLTLSLSLHASKYNTATASEESMISSNIINKADAKMEGPEEDVRYAYYQLAAGSVFRNYGRYVFRLKYTVAPSGQVSVDLEATQNYINGYHSHKTLHPTAFASGNTKSEIPNFTSSSTLSSTTVTINWRYYDGESDPSDPDIDSGKSTIIIDKNGSQVGHAANVWPIPEEDQGLIKIPFVTTQK